MTKYEIIIEETSIFSCYINVTENSFKIFEVWPSIVPHTEKYYVSYTNPTRWGNRFVGADYLINKLGIPKDIVVKFTLMI